MRSCNASPLPLWERVPEGRERGVGRKLLSYAKDMRSAPTNAEAWLWRHLRAGRLQGFKFKRQQPMQNYIVDFVCFEARLVVELDGGQHAQRIVHDEVRTQWLQSQGFRVHRFWNDEALCELEVVLGAILRTLEERTM